MYLRCRANCPSHQMLFSCRSKPTHYARATPLCTSLFAPSGLVDSQTGYTPVGQIAALRFDPIPRPPNGWA